MRATLWQGADDLAALRREILRVLFAHAGLSLHVVETLEDLLAAAAHSRRASDQHLLLIDCGVGESADIDRCLAVLNRTTQPIHIIHPRPTAIQALERRTGRVLGWLPADFTTFALLDTVRALTSPVVTVSTIPAGSEAPRQTLSARERDVFRLHQDGDTSAQIAARLGIKPNTVKTHLAAARRKMAAAADPCAEWSAAG